MKILYWVKDARVYALENNRILIEKDGEKTTHDIINNVLNTLVCLFKNNEIYIKELQNIEANSSIFSEKTMIDQNKRKLLSNFNGDKSNRQYSLEMDKLEKIEHELQ